MSEWREISTVPTDTSFDLIAKYYDASLDMFIQQRFANCIKQDDRFFWCNPFQKIGIDDVRQYDLLNMGYKPILWMPLPAPPDKN